MCKKINVFVLLIFFTCVLTSCGLGSNDVINDNNSVLSSNRQNSKKPESNSFTDIYNLIKSNYTNQDINISYPQINGLSDINKQDSINEIIKSEALKILNIYNVNLNNLSLEVDYNIKWKGVNLFSIQFAGTGYVKNGAYPNNIFYTLNINMGKGSKLRLKDLVNIDQSFVEKLKGSQYKVLTPGLNVESYAKDELKKYDNNQLIDYLNKADDIGGENISYTFSYFTNDSLGISINVAHAIGDHAEFEINYIDIKDNMKNNSEIWKDFSNMHTK